MSLTKFIKLNELQNLKKRLEGNKLVFTNGCFDIFHSGHARYLKLAKSLGDILVVGINSDLSVKMNKGESRPINNLIDRVCVLESLECVDYIVEFNEKTPLSLISALLPHVLVKGGDYEAEEIVGHDIVTKNGGRVQSLPYYAGLSTTDIIEKIKG